MILLVIGGSILTAVLYIRLNGINFVQVSKPNKYFMSFSLLSSYKYSGNLTYGELDSELNVVISIFTMNLSTLFFSIEAALSISIAISSILIPLLVYFTAS